MLIAIISDIHDNIPNLKKVLDYIKAVRRIEKIICCGDLASQETLNYLCDNFSGEIFFTFGNMDQEHASQYHVTNGKYRNAKIFTEFGEVSVDGFSVAFVHFPDVAEQLSVLGKYDYVFYGHTHMPWEKQIQNTKMLNPGNVANQHYSPTFAVWNTSNNSFELIRINNLA